MMISKLAARFIQFLGRDDVSMAFFGMATGFPIGLDLYPDAEGVRTERERVSRSAFEATPMDGSRSPSPMPA